MYIFKIPKMSCGGCLNTITSAIKSLDENAAVEADVATKVVKIDSSLTEVELLTKLSNIGYPAITE